MTSVRRKGMNYSNTSEVVSLECFESQQYIYTNFLKASKYLKYVCSVLVNRKNYKRKSPNLKLI